MTRTELQKLIEEVEQDEPFTMPLFLIGCIRDMMERQNLPSLSSIETGGENFSAVLEFAQRQKRIVAEVCKSWPEDSNSIRKGETISEIFESVVGTNLHRGYDLESWQYSKFAGPNGRSITETIIAVFIDSKRLCNS